MKRFLFQRSHPTDPKRVATKAEENFLHNACLFKKEKLVYDHRQVRDCGDPGGRHRADWQHYSSELNVFEVLFGLDRSLFSLRISKYDNDISFSVQFFPRPAPLTSPTRCCGVTASSTSSTSSIPSPSTKSTIHHSTQSTSKKSLHKLGDLFTLKAALDPYPPTNTH